MRSRRRKRHAADTEVKVDKKTVDMTFEISK
jgi:hypothetical protein